MFAVQCTETDLENGCKTLRRFYVTVFDFDVDVALVSDDAGSDANYDGNETAYCNSWDGLVIENGLSQSEIQAMDAGALASTVIDSNKFTTSYFQVTIRLVGGPSTVTLDDYHWRFQYSFPLASDLAVYDVTAITGGPTFTTATGNNYIGRTATDDITFATFSLDAFASNNSVYIPASTTATYIFRVRTHNILGQDPSMIYDVRIDQVQLRNSATEAAAGVYTSGEKVHPDVIAAVTGRTLFDVDNLPSENNWDGRTGTRTINQSPATTTIKIVE